MCRGSEVDVCFRDRARGDENDIEREAQSRELLTEQHRQCGGYKTKHSFDSSANEVAMPALTTGTTWIRGKTKHVQLNMIECNADSIMRILTLEDWRDGLES